MMHKVIGFMSNRVMLTDGTTRDVFIDDEGRLVTFSKDDENHPEFEKPVGEE